MIIFLSIFNKMFDRGVFSAQWRDSLVVLLLKSGGK